MESRSSQIVSPRTARRALYGMAAGVGLCVALIQVSLFDTSDFAHIPWTKVAIVALMIGVAEHVVIRLAVRRQVLAFNIMEIPILFAMFWLPPLVMLALRIPFSIYVRTIRRPMALPRALYNTSVNYLEMSLAMLIFAHIGHTDPGDPRTWVAVYVAFAPANLFGSLAVMAGMVLMWGAMDRTDVVNAFVASIVPLVVNPTLGLVALIALDVNPWSVIPLMVLGAVMIAGYRLYTRSRRHFHIVEGLYEFTSTIDTARLHGGFADVILNRARQLIGAEQAALWVPAQGRHAEVSLVAKAGEHGLIDDARQKDAIRQRVIETGRSVAASLVNSPLPMADPELAAELRNLKFEEVIAVPLRSGSSVIGCLEFTNRIGEFQTFNTDELRLAEMIAAHAAVAMENARLLDRLRFDGYHDSLTGLANRRQLQQALSTAIQDAPSPGEVVAIMQFDIDSLRDVNETLGHEAGNRLLIEIGRRLRDKAPSGALVARLDGDEFALVMRVQGADAATAAALDLRLALAEPVTIDKLSLDVSTAVGIALFPDHGTDAETLLQRADVANQVAKNNPRAIQLYQPTMEQRSLHRLSLVSELRHAIDDDALTVYYQPKVKLASKELVGMECLVRWEHPDHGVVSPEDFAPIAEHAGLAGLMARHVLKTSLAQCRRWREQGNMLGVSVNLSPRNLLDPHLPNQIRAMLAEAGVPADQLTLEFAESAFAAEIDTRSERPLRALRELHDIGVRIAIDDFGAGHSTLSYLQKLPVHEVKIDRSLIAEMTSDPGDLGVVRTVTDLGHRFGLVVVAEGVENELTLTMLEQTGCDIVQGFLFSRPLPADRIDEWMALQTRHVANTGPDETPTHGNYQRIRVLSG